MNRNKGYLCGGVLLVAQVFLAGCERTPEVEPAVPPPAEVEEVQAPPSTPPPLPAKPKPTPITLQGAGPQTGTKFYLKQRISITHDAGVIGFPAGTVIDVVGRKGNVVTASVSGVRFDVMANNVTTDPGEIAVVAAPPIAPAADPAGNAPSRPVPVAATSAASAAASAAADRADRRQKADQLRMEITRLKARRRELYEQLSAMRNPDRTPEGKARKAEVRQIGLTIEQYYVQIGQLSR